MTSHKNSLISDKYLSLLRTMHEYNKEWGNSSAVYLDIVGDLIEQNGATTLLDYGCGKGALVKMLPGAVGYDPAVPEYAKRPEGTFDIVICTDVMEHVEREHVDDVLRDICCLSKGGCVFFSIACYPAIAELPDGRNAHITLETSSWWLERIRYYWPQVPSPIGEQDELLLFIPKV